MSNAPEKVWVAVLRRRAEQMRKSAETARTPFIAEELGELAQIYDDAAIRAETQPPLPIAPHMRPDPRAEMIQYVQHRAHLYLVQSRTNLRQAEELKFLSGAFGAEAARLRPTSSG